MKEGTCTHHTGAFLNLGTGRNQGGNPRSRKAKDAVCAHAHALSWQHPPWGEASTCPIPEQGAGAATRPQLTQGRGMRGEGTAAQVALLRSWNPPDLTRNPLPAPRLTTAGQTRS